MQALQHTLSVPTGDVFIMLYEPSSRLTNCGQTAMTERNWSLHLPSIQPCLDNTHCRADIRQKHCILIVCRDADVAARLQADL